MNELNALISRNLKTLRAVRNLTQDGLAEAAGISKNYLAEIEIGRKYPSSGVYLKLAYALGVKPFFLLLESTPPYVTAPDGSKASLMNEMKAVLDRHGLSDDASRERHGKDGEADEYRER